MSPEEIRQTGATGIFTSRYEVPCGEAWSVAAIAEFQAAVAAAGLAWRVVESVPVSEAI